MKVSDLLREAATELPAGPGLPDPLREARWLLAAALGCPESWLLSHAEDSLPLPSVERFRAWLARRRAGEPAHYIVGACPFWGRDFIVSPAVLVPRPETELLIASALALPPGPPHSLLDVGTGSGCLAVTLALELSAAYVAATDVSLSALAVARANARRHGAVVSFLAADLVEPLAGRFDLVVANLPYLPSGVLASLAPEIRAHEPRDALVAGPRGDELVARLVGDLPRLLAPGGHALLEIGEGQAETATVAAIRAGLLHVATLPDAAGINRVIGLARPQTGTRE
jgi:release factor glutamine methyltransferase